MPRSSQSHLATVRRHYPNADRAEDVIGRFVTLLNGRFGLVASQVTIADSVCSDDVNAVEYPDAAKEMLGPFKLGGLDGFPFGGLTGLGAFAHHVPDGGALFLFHAPHIGVTQGGDVGHIVRRGQEANSTCCGAAQAGLAKLKAGTMADELDELDYQQGVLERILAGSRERIESAQSPIKEATEVIYEAIERRIDALVERTAFPCEHVFVMGAILINGDWGVGAHVDVRRLKHLNVRTAAAQDLLEELQARA